jgi:hypothetical protein
VAEQLKVVLCEFDVEGGAVVLHMLRFRCSYGDYALLPEYPREGDLRGSGAVLLGDEL